MTPWARACTALQLVAIDPAGLGGIAVRARVGPARDALVAALDGLSLPRLRLHPALQADQLDGGVDVAGSLGSGTLIRQRSLLDRAATVFILPMAERLSPLLNTRLCALLDTDIGHLVVALDEGCEADEAVPSGLLDRLALHIDLQDVARADIAPVDLQPARDVRRVALPETAIEEIAHLAVRMGITSLRAPTLALRAARAHAALQGRPAVTAEDVLVAAELVLAPRATQMPQTEAPEQAPPDTSDNPDEQTATDDSLRIPDDILLAAIRTALPPDVLAGSAKAARASSGSGAGVRRVGNRRGRPLPARNGSKPGTNARVDLFATLRAAVPWQRIRQQQYPYRTGPIILPQDLTYKRYLDLSDRLLIFAVDASGSSAVSRLAEAKGAIEYLLAEAYAKRDQVSLIAFRGEGAETLLPPTRSLVQTKRRLADLPGGGATPLAAGMKAGLETAIHARRKGLSPVLILLTDGRGNIALDGAPDRAQAADDAKRIAALLTAAGIDNIVIDTANRPQQSLKSLADTLRGRYIALPRADARRLSEAVSASLDD